MGIHRMYVCKVDIAPPKESVLHAASRTRGHNVGLRVVCDNANRPLGVLTDCDLPTRVVAAGRDSVSKTIAGAMTKHIGCLPQDASIEMVLQSIRATPCQRLPVVNEDGRLIGLIMPVGAINWLVDGLGEIRAVLDRKTTSSLAVGS